MGKSKKRSGVIAYTIDFTRRSRRQFLKLPAQIQNRISPHIDALGTEPRPSGCIKLKRFSDRYRIRVGAYRILYEIRDDILVVLVMEIGHRRDIYR